MMQSTTVRIGDYDYKIGMLSFKTARPVYSKIQKLLVLNEDEIASSGLGLFMFAGFAGGIDDATLGELIDAFGAVTQVTITPTQTLALSKEEARNIVFAGRLEDMFSWLDECVKYNFAGCMAKLEAARSTFEAKRAAKAEPKP